MGRIAVRVQTRAKRNEIAGQREGALVVRVTAPPVESRANDMVCKVLAERFGVPQSHVSVVRGASSRNKLIEVAGVDTEAIMRELG
jgi:uncharacterized protein (TIGR00251 family)